MDEERKEVKEQKTGKEQKAEGKGTEKPEKPKKPDKPKKGKSKIMFILIFLILCGALGGGYFLYGDKIMKKYMGGQTEGQAEGQKDESTKKKGGVGPILALEPFVFNLTGNSAKFARVSLGVELKDPKVMEEAKKMVPAIRDKALTVLGTKGPEVLMDVNQRNEIKKEIFNNLKTLFKDNDELKSVYITDIIIQ